MGGESCGRDANDRGGDGQHRFDVDVPSDDRRHAARGEGQESGLLI